MLIQYFAQAILVALPLITHFGGASRIAAASGLTRSQEERARRSKLRKVALAIAIATTVFSVAMLLNATIPFLFVQILGSSAVVAINLLSVRRAMHG